MPPSRVPYVGARLREERLRQGVTLRALARELGVSASLISQIETGRSQPSVSTLYAITSALGISVEDVFGPPRAAGPAATSGDGDGAAETLLDVLGSRPATRVGPVVRADERQVLRLDSGVTWQRLGQVTGKHVDFLLITYEPGGSSSSTGLPMRHGGTEYGYVLEGELVLTLGFDEHRLRAGDAVSFESSTPHRYRNEGTEPAVGVWFVAELE